MIQRKVAVVTGATSGIGLAISEMLLSEGHAVLATGRSANPISSDSPSLRTVRADLLDSSTPSNVLEAALREFGQVDFLFVNAGTIESGSVDDIDIEKMCSMIRLKVEASFRTIYTFLRYFKSIGRGHVFITSSVLGTKTRENSGAYAGANHALEALAESLRMELSDTDIEITCIEPGLVQTNLHRDWPVQPKELLNISTTLNPSDIADAIKDILSKPSHVRIPKYMILPKGHKI